MGAAILVKAGDLYGRLTIVREVDHRGRDRQFECRCDCGNIHLAILESLRCGDVKSCGCLHLEHAATLHRTHGLSHLPEYNRWHAMVNRCTNASGDCFEHYGGRGISIVPAWRDDFTAFFEYIGPMPSPAHEIERINNDGNYEPGNVKWGTRGEQVRNTRRTIWINHNGIRWVLVDLCRELKIGYTTVQARRKRGCAESELFGPVSQIRKRKT